ncbi:hypothetical protein [Yersinia hibernica]|uniref:Uncharacterized protein n=1 Tax=Yersinia enterocolitica LC20 TaxID=1443113 RepID=A0A7U5PGW8_YEREN|nr:hypothetical protein [Yersinia hibernica]ATX62955.1 hypothetical protein LC20_08525 [Yersinia hibernica]OVZ89039.1 hypothetical protein CBW54_08675 [Yersinia kristensenii]
MSLLAFLSTELPCWPVGFNFIAQDLSGEIHAFISKPRLDIATNRWGSVLGKQLITRTSIADDWNGAVVSQAAYLNKEACPLRVLVFSV